MVFAYRSYALYSIYIYLLLLSLLFVRISSSGVHFLTIRNSISQFRHTIAAMAAISDRAIVQGNQMMWQKTYTTAHM